MRGVDVVAVAATSVWDELAAASDLTTHLREPLDDLSRVAAPSFHDDLVPVLRSAGIDVLVRYARRDAAQVASSRTQLASVVAGLPRHVQSVLFAAQRHAVDDVVIGSQAWDPSADARAVRALHGAGVLMALPDATEHYAGRYRLNPDLPPPPGVAYDFEDAVMPETDDLGPARPGPISLLHDLAALAAALRQVGPRRTQAGTVTRSHARQLGRRLANPAMQAGGGLEAEPRWQRALRALEALGAVSMDPMSRQLHVDPAVEATLGGTTREAVDRLVHKLVDRDLHVVLPAIRSALAQAGGGAIDDMVFDELIEEQHREILFPACVANGERVYPGDAGRPFDSDGFQLIERRLIRRALERAERLGLIRRAPGVFASTPEGRQWAGAPAHAAPPIWVTSDLEVVVPPNAVTPWERYQLERIGRCIARDVVDRYRLERGGLVEWLATHDMEDALGLLQRRSVELPAVVRETLGQWHRSVTRVTLTRGVLLGQP
jgi:hypothetical protein